MMLSTKKLRPIDKRRDKMPVALKKKNQTDSINKKTPLDDRKNKVEYRCDAFPSDDRILLRSIKFVESPDHKPGDAQQFDMTYNVVEISPDEALDLAMKLVELARSAISEDGKQEFTA